MLAEAEFFLLAHSALIGCLTVAILVALMRRRVNAMARALLLPLLLMLAAVGTSGYGLYRQHEISQSPLASMVTEMVTPIYGGALILALAAVGVLAAVSWGGSARSYKQCRSK